MLFFSFRFSPCVSFFGRKKTVGKGDPLRAVILGASISRRERRVYTTLLFGWDAKDIF